MPSRISASSIVRDWALVRYNTAAIASTSSASAARAVRVMKSASSSSSLPRKPELRGVLRPHPLALFHEIDRLEQQVVEVERVALLQRLEVIGIDLRDLLVA